MDHQNFVTDDLGAIAGVDAAVAVATGALFKAIFLTRDYVIPRDVHARFEESTEFPRGNVVLQNLGPGGLLQPFNAGIVVGAGAVPQPNYGRNFITLFDACIAALEDPEMRGIRANPQNEFGADEMNLAHCIMGFLFRADGNQNTQEAVATILGEYRRRVALGDYQDWRIRVAQALQLGEPQQRIAPAGGGGFDADAVAIGNVPVLPNGPDDIICIKFGLSFSKDYFESVCYTHLTLPTKRIV